MEDGLIGLALGGGVARGWSHIGVIRALHEAGIFPDIIAGTSIGAVVGGCHSAKRLDDLEDFARGLNRRRMFGYLDFNLAGTGLINGHRLGETLKQALGDAQIEDLDTRFVAVATEIGSGHEIWLSQGPLVEAVRASYALPGIFRPVKLNNRWLFDGALVNPVPISVCRALGARYVIAVNLNFDLSSRASLAPQVEPARPSPSPSADALDDQADKGVQHAVEFAADETSSGARKRSNAKRLLQRQLLQRTNDVPGISTVVVEAFNIVQDRIARSRLAGDPPDAMISPRLHGIGLFDFHRADELITRGRVAVARDLETIQHEIDIRRKHGMLRDNMKSGAV
ncbi:MAG: patatin-like phospholipase family protein [Pseudomonadota bacterium]